MALTVEQTLQEFRRRRKQAGNDTYAETKVGYSAPYAIYVHENLLAYHKEGQAKFLEQPMRTEKAAMADIIRRRLVGAHDTLKNAQLEAAKHLMKTSLPLVPIDKGVLRASWFII